MNDTLKFFNNHLDSVSFIVKEKNISDDNTKYGRSEKYACHSGISASAISSINSESNILLAIIYPDIKQIYFNISISLDDKRGVFSLFTTDINENIISSIEIDNQIYKNVIIMTIDTIKHPSQSDFWKVIVSQNIGIIKIFEKGNDKVWTLNK